MTTHAGESHVALFLEIMLFSIDVAMNLYFSKQTFVSPELALYPQPIHLKEQWVMFLTKSHFCL